MKTLLRILPLVFAFTLFSCQKEEIPAPVTPAGTTTVQVEYRATAVSNHMDVYQMVPVNGVMQEEKVEINRSTYSYSFEVTSGTEVRVKARNTIGNSDEVTVEVYVNGTLLESGSANAPGAYAVAEGIAR